MIIRDAWGSPNPVFRHFFTSNFIPDAPPEVAGSFDELQRIATSPENALRNWDLTVRLDVTELAKQVRVPALVLHCTGDRVAPLEEGMARLIPGASFIELPGNNHALLALAGTPAFGRFLEEATDFVATHAC
jgi:pimeloyl-ACP methyl ester carboxylesterase